MSHINEEYYKQAKKNNGGLIIFIDLLDKYKVNYDLTSKYPSARVSIPTVYGKIAAYDRVKNKLIRMDIPTKHPLARSYKSINGFLHNENNIITEDKEYVYVYFYPKDFDNLIKAIRSN